MNTVKSESGTPDAGEWSKAVQGYAEKGKLITFPSGKKVKTPYQRPFQRMGFASQDTLEKWMKQGMSMAAIAECLEKDIHISAMGSSVSETQKKAERGRRPCHRGRPQTQGSGGPDERRLTGIAGA